jgi:hypothetical protein
MNLIPTPRWIMDESFFNHTKHDILKNVIHVFTSHPQSSFINRHKHNGKQIHAIASWIINNCYLILFTFFGGLERR